MVHGSETSILAQNERKPSFCFDCVEGQLNISCSFFLILKGQFWRFPVIRHTPKANEGDPSVQHQFPHNLMYIVVQLKGSVEKRV